MTTRVEAGTLRVFFARAWRRLTWIAVAEGAAGGLAIAVAIGILGWFTGRSFDATVIVGCSIVALSVIACVAPRIGQRQPMRSAAEQIEARALQCRNLFITAAELLDRPARVPPDISDLVFGEAEQLASTLDLAALFPMRRALTALAIAAVLWTGTLALVAAHPDTSSLVSPARTTSADITGVDVTIVPPAYTARAAQSLHNPARIEALAGSQLRVTVHANAASIAMETLDGRQTLAATASRTFSGSITANADGYIAVEPKALDQHTGARRLIGLSVTADLPPRVRITAPGRDLFLPNVHRTLDLTVEADDDIGLASLRLKYTKVSGSGEQFKFVDGEVPLSITRTDARSWKARGTLTLDSLGLSPGDLVVYRGIAADGRPGALPSESDSYIVEISAPGDIAASGFAIDDERDRYMVSQQMVIIKTEKLIASTKAPAAKSTNPPAILSDSEGSLLPGIRDSALALAAEQRKVRSEFVFMMGGELAEDVIAAADMNQLHEEAEANAEGDLAAGRLANQGRVALVGAIRSMSLSATSLTIVNLDDALKHERAALAFLQGAFSRTRYILRALTERERLDLSRRLTGGLADAGRDMRPTAATAGDPRVAPLRRALSGIAALAGTSPLNADDAARASMLAEGVLRVDPSSAPLQQVAARLTDAASAIASAHSGEAQMLLDRAAIALATAMRGDLHSAPPPSAPFDVGRLDGALADALRRSGGLR